jgi:antitoxin (DNA-binding transcriptional repressor) of toxin-antitoxin stability system
MKNIVSISNARKELPKLIREIEKNPEAVFKITVRNETVAEIRSAKTMVQPGEAVQKLLRLRKKLSSTIRSQSQEPISQRVKDYLYLQGSE